MSDKVVVRFLKAWRGYSADELAGFDETVADGLKAKGFAESYSGAGSRSGKAPKPSRNQAKTASAPPAIPEQPTAQTPAEDSTDDPDNEAKP